MGTVVSPNTTGYPVTVHFIENELPVVSSSIRARWGLSGLLTPPTGWIAAGGRPQRRYVLGTPPPARLRSAGKCYPRNIRLPLKLALRVPEREVELDARILQGRYGLG